MTLRTGHGQGAGSPRIEVLPADELPKGVQGEPLAEHRAERDGAGRFRPGARTAQSAGGASSRDMTRLARRLALGESMADPRFEPFLRAARAFRAHHVTELARTVGGGRCSSAPSSIVASAALQLAASRFAFEVLGDLALGSRLADASRQNLLAAHELCAREAQARPSTPSDTPFRGNVLNEVSLVTVPADPRALVTDAAPHAPDWRDYAHAVYTLRERALETGDPEDERLWHEAQADYSSRFSDAPRLPGQGGSRILFDAVKQTRTSCSCQVGGGCSCSFNPQKVTTDMAESKDYLRGKADAEAARGGPSAADLENARKFLRAQARRSSAPLATVVHSALSTALDAWDISQLADRPSTSTVTPAGATAAPRAGDQGAKVTPRGASAPGASTPTRAERPAHLRSFADLGVPGGLTKRNATSFAGMHSPVNFMSEPPDHDPEAA